MVRTSRPSGPGLTCVHVAGTGRAERATVGELAFHPPLDLLAITTDSNVETGISISTVRKIAGEFEMTDSELMARARL